VGFLDRAAVAAEGAEDDADALHDEDRVLSWTADGGERLGRTRREVEEAIAAQLDRAADVGRRIGNRAGFVTGGVAGAVLLVLFVVVLTWR